MTPVRTTTLRRASLNDGGSFITETEALRLETSENRFLRRAKNSFQNDDAVMTMRVVGALMPGRETRIRLCNLALVSAVGDREQALCAVDSFQFVHAAVIEPEAGAGDDVLDRL
jgi:hypothetical protein